MMLRLLLFIALFYTLAIGVSATVAMLGWTMP